MENLTSKSTKTLHILVIALLLIPVLWSVGIKIYYRDVYNNNGFQNYWSVFQTLITGTLIFLVYKKMYGILLYLIAAAIFNLIISIIRLIQFPLSFSFIEYVFFGLTVINLLLMTLLLSRENNRLMNLKFSSRQVGFRRTYMLIRSLNIAVCIIIPAIILLILGFVSAEKLVYLNGYSLFWLIILVFTLIGTINKSKFLLLAFTVSLLLIADLFYSSYIFIIAPFVGNWNNGWDQISIYIGLIVNGLLLFFGLFLFFIARAYFREKAELKEQSGILL